MDFKEKIKPRGYVDRIDDSLLDYYALVRGSINVLISDTYNIITRKGLSLVGQVGTSLQGIKSAYTWYTNTNKEINLRSIYDKIQILYNGSWQNVATGLKNFTKFQARPWWDRAEIKDKLLLVTGLSTVLAWTGGFTEIASWTATTLTKKFAKQSSVTNNFVFDAATQTLTQTDADFVTLGFVVGQTLNIAGTANNNGLYTIRSVTPSVITVSADDIFVNETIATTAGLIGVLGRETWAAERFATQGTMQVNIGGTVFSYTGGFNTPTLTGLSSDPSGVASVGLFVYQPFAAITPSGGDFPTGQLIDVIEVNINQTYYGYTKSRNVFLAKQTNFADCAYTTSIRKAGEGGTIFLDNNCTGIAASKQLTQITAGDSDVYNVTLNVFSDGVNAGETIEVTKLETAAGQGAVSADCFVKVKNGILYVSKEPAIDFLGNVENIVTQQTEPVSYDIKRLLNSIDRSNAVGVYNKNIAFFLFPNANVLLMRDMERGFWQPPQTVGGSALSIINGDVHVHSSLTDETYKLFSTLADNNKPIIHVARTNIDTYGTRLTRKVYDEVFVEAIVNGAAKLVNGTLYSGFQGSTFIHPFQFGYDMESRFTETPPSPSGFGSAPFGTLPFGGLFTDPTEDPDIGQVKKIYAISSIDIFEAFTHQMEFSDDEIGVYFEIICWGTNARLSEDTNLDLKI